MAFSNQQSSLLASQSAPRRLSRRIQGLDPQPAFEINPERTPYLPPEVKSLVAECLDKSNLKSLRCVSKQWHAVATPLLFDKIYISLRRKDIEVFEKITRHPVLSESIKEMICDVSKISDLSYEDYFYCLCYQISYIVCGLSRRFPFKSPHPRLNQFINTIIQIRTSYDELFESYDELFDEFCNDDLVTEGFQVWQELAAEERHSFDPELRGKFFSDLCSGLNRLPNLQSVKMDDDIWGKNRREISHTMCPAYHPSALPVIWFGSPLARSWYPRHLWHLAPRKPEDAGFAHFFLVIEALSKTKRSIKHFDHASHLDNGLSPDAFRGYRMTDSFPRHMATAFWQLKSLELKITPRSSQFLDHEDKEALGFLPQLLEQTTGLTRLGLHLLTAERLKWQRSRPLTPLHDACYTYSQVFPHYVTWPHLESFYLSGLAVEGCELVLLLTKQMPKLRLLWLNRIDLLESRWEGVVEALRLRGTFIPWELISLQGLLRHKVDQWWPCTPDKEDETRLALMDAMAYIEDGGRHPNLPAHCEDSQSISYFHDMIYGL
ncbi:hypothetical protein MMC28_011071 [Mycoblastus sanguinarius]|nr:hypothetical protein [Mycoblastus sanguinarius]